jgi:hypothetical protein
MQAYYVSTLLSNSWNFLSKKNYCYWLRLLVKLIKRVHNSNERQKECSIQVIQGDSKVVGRVAYN